MELRPITKVLVNILLLVCSSAAQDGSTNTTCDAPTVKKGAEGHVICHFPVDLSTVAPPVTVSVELYPFKNKQQVFILECHSMEGIEVICNTEREGYTFNKIFGKDIVVNITEASEDSLGRYVCKSMYAKSPQQQPIPCNFVFEGTTPPTEYGPSTTGTTPPTEYGPSTTDGGLHVKPEDSSPDITVIVILCICVVAVVVGVVICIILYRKRKLTCHRPKMNLFGDSHRHGMEAVENGSTTFLASDVTETGEMKDPSITDIVKNGQFQANPPRTATNSDVTETGETNSPGTTDAVKYRHLQADLSRTPTNSDVAEKDEGPGDTSKGVEPDVQTPKPAASSDVTETGEMKDPSITDIVKNGQFQANPPRTATNSVTQEKTDKSKSPAVKDLIKGFEVKDNAQSTTTSSFGAGGGGAADMKRTSLGKDASVPCHGDADADDEVEKEKEEEDDAKNTSEADALIESPATDHGSSMNPAPQASVDEADEADAKNTSETDRLICAPASDRASSIGRAHPEEAKETKEAEDEDPDQPTDQGVTQTANDSSSPSHKRTGWLW